MIQIRKGVFETNSSSTHSICISKEKIKAKDVDGRKIYFGFGEYGWEFGCVNDTASYLHTAIADMSRIKEYKERIKRIKQILNKYGVEYEFEPVKFVDNEYGGYVIPADNRYAYVDHAGECADMVDALLNDEDLLIRYLFGKSCIYTGYDISDCSDMCNEAESMVWEDTDLVPNPNHDPKHYDYFYKGN